MSERFYLPWNNKKNLSKDGSKNPEIRRKKNNRANIASLLI